MLNHKRNVLNSWSTLKRKYHLLMLRITKTVVEEWGESKQSHRFPENIGKDWIKVVLHFWHFGNEMLVTVMLVLKYISSCSLPFKANYRLKFHIQHSLDNLWFMGRIRLLFHAVFIALAMAVIHSSSSRLLFPVDQH